MNRTILLAIFAAICVTIADKAVDWQQPEAKTYSAKERDAMDRLVERVLYEAKHRHEKPLSDKAKSALAAVYHVTPQNIDADIFGGAR